MQDSPPQAFSLCTLLWDGHSPANDPYLYASPLKIICTPPMLTIEGRILERLEALFLS